MNNVIHINTEFITVAQFLKKVGLIQTGGHAKMFIEASNINLRGQKPNKHTKIFPSDVIKINNKMFLIKKES